MPKKGMIVRIAFALVAAAGVAVLAVGGAGAAAAKRTGTTLNGAGSSLIAPAVQGVWAPNYSSAKGVTVNYNSVGSGTGIADLSAGTVDFGASDAPLSAYPSTECSNCVQMPWALAATGPVVNIPNVNTLQLKLTGQVLAKIYLGKITSWNDPAITALNPGLNLPNLHITPVHRSDGSGDTYAFTDYLSKISSQWKSQVGKGTTVSWPVGVGGNKNPGVAAIVDSTSGAIGYVSTAYVIQNHLRIAKVKNASGKFTAPTVRSIEAAAQLVKAKKIPKNNEISITNPPKTKNKKYENAYPISTFTYVMVPKNAPQAAALKAFITWVLSPAAQKSIQHLVFAPMPAVVVNAAKKTLKSVK